LQQVNPMARSGREGLTPFTSPTEHTMPRHPHRRHARPTALLTACLCLAASLSACGLGDSGSAAVTAAKLKASEADNARATKQKLEQQIADTQQQAAQRQKEIDAATR
jgi:uncharacterized protein YlxW (UPF0749 family)